VGRHFHTGIDIALPSGTPLPALASGVVAQVALDASAGRLAGYGGVVRVDTLDGRSYFYAHCRRVLVAPGQKVSQGQILAESGGGPADPHHGLTDGAHLHLETWDHNGDHFNPLTVLQIRDAARKAA
jgi:murein DD-endopeptidase MepM/ murein hydrolase activator NlpD